MSQPRPQPAAEHPFLVQIDANHVGQPPTTMGSERRRGDGSRRAAGVGCQQGVMRRPSLREQIPHLSALQLAALRRVVRAGGRLPIRALPHEMTTCLLAVHAVSANRRVGELRLTHLGVLAPVGSQDPRPEPDPTLAHTAAGKGKGFAAVTLEDSR